MTYPQTASPSAHHVDQEAAELTEFWSQKTLFEANGSLFKVAKGIRSTEWHSHDDQDEVFFVTSGELIVELRSGDVTVSAGDVFVVPQGTEHRPRASEEVRFLIVGTSVTSTAAGGKPAWSADGGRSSDSAGEPQVAEPEAPALG